MPTMQDVARAAGVSRTTVSIVVNGQHKERKIPEETRERIYTAMKELGYRPNVSAKRLKDSNSSLPIIALFWPMDYRMNYLARFMQGIQSRVKSAGYQCELLMQTFENDYIEKDAHSILRGNYSGAIIAATSKRDLEYLESISPQIPVVLINRDSDKYFTVSANNLRIAEKCAQLFLQKGHKRVAVLSAENPYMAAGLRTRLFLQYADSMGMSTDSFVMKTANNMEGGVHAAKQFAALDNRPSAMFCDSDYIAMGFAYACNRLGIRIPEDLEIIAVGMLTADFTEYTTPSITVVTLPLEEMAADGLDQIMEALKTNSRTPVHRVHNAKVLIRESYVPE